MGIAPSFRPLCLLGQQCLVLILTTILKIFPSFFINGMDANALTVTLKSWNFKKILKKIGIW